MRELFRQISDPHPSVGNRRLTALPVSIAVHAAVLMAVVAIPLLATDILPDVRLGDVIFENVVLPQVPSVPPPAVPRQAAVVGPDTNLAPVVQPAGIGDEHLIRTDATPDLGVPDTSSIVPGDIPAGLNVVTGSEPPPPPRPTAPVPVHTLLRAPVRVQNVAPIYPEIARAAHVQGTVIIEAIISTTGDVVQAKVLRSVPLLDQSALDAVRQWKYTPSLLNGIPVPVVMTVTVTFSLR